MRVTRTRSASVVPPQLWQKTVFPGLVYMFASGFADTWSVVAERSSALESSSGVVRMWVRIPAWPVTPLVSLSKTLNHNCFVLWMGRKAVRPVCCVMHVKEPRTLIVKEKGLAPVFLDSRREHPAGCICARYKSSVFCILTIVNWTFIDF